MYRKSLSKSARKNGSSPKKTAPKPYHRGLYDGASPAIHLKPIPKDSRRTGRVVPIEDGLLHNETMRKKRREIYLTELKNQILIST
jgi:hypothetical protein